LNLFLTFSISGIGGGIVSKMIELRSKNDQVYRRPNGIEALGASYFAEIISARGCLRPDFEAYYLMPGRICGEMSDFA
jgi:hypothetical protein